MKYKLKDPGSAITHGIAFLLAAVGAAPLLIRSSEWSDHIHIVALGVFILTMMLLYAVRDFVELLISLCRGVPQNPADGYSAPFPRLMDQSTEGDEN